MNRVMSVVLAASVCLAGSWVTGADTGPAYALPAAAMLTPAAVTPAVLTPAVLTPAVLTPYDAAHYADLYSDPAGAITGATYIFNPTVNWRPRMAFDFAQMRQVGINTVGLYNLVQMTDISTFISARMSSKVSAQSRRNG